MRVCNNLTELHEMNRVWRTSGHTIAFVPTMGNLHAGHLELVRKAKQIADRVVVSIFVNPMQFAEGEDFDRYPRTLDKDIKLLEKAGVDALFLPDEDMIYPRGLEHSTVIEVPHLSDRLCGRSRPGHFRGVTTVVSKLINLVRPDYALFGEKDFQQLQIIRRMADDLALWTEIIGVPTVRESNGLAMSSRNQYLTEQEREQAGVLYLTLQQSAEQIMMGQRDYRKIEKNAAKRLKNAGFKVDYVEICNKHDLQPATPEDNELCILAAAHLGKARLIDNIQLTLED